MPGTRIITGSWAVGKELTLIEAVQSALQESIKIPDWDRDVVVDVYDPDAVNWGLRGGIPASEIDFGYKIEV